MFTSATPLFLSLPYLHLTIIMVLLSQTVLSRERESGRERYLCISGEMMKLEV
jgi:hypothetical protein